MAGSATPPAYRWLPAGPLARFTAAGLPHVEHKCRLCNQASHVRRSDRVSWLTADKIACHLKVHPCVIWGDAWWLPIELIPEVIPNYGSRPVADTKAGKSLVLLGDYRANPSHQRIPVRAVGRTARGSGIAG